MDNDYAERLAAKLAPGSTFLALSRAGSFLCAYELIRSEIVDGVHNFFGRGFDETGLLYDEAEYQRSVLARNPKSKYRASCAWLVEMGALTVKQIAVLEDIYRHRQEIAHELPKLLIDPDFEVRTDLLQAAVKCIQRLGVFWGSIEVDTNPDFDGADADCESIKSGSMLLMEHLLSIIESIDSAIADGASPRDGSACVQADPPKNET